MRLRCHGEFYVSCNTKSGNRESNGVAAPTTSKICTYLECVKGSSCCSRTLLIAVKVKFSGCRCLLVTAGNNLTSASRQATSTSAPKSLRRNPKKVPRPHPSFSHHQPVSAFPDHCFGGVTVEAPSARPPRRYLPHRYRRTTGCRPNWRSGQLELTFGFELGVEGVFQAD